MGKFKWEFDPDNFPDQRNNWKAMSEGMKSYTIIQYNKARERRGLPPIPNPFSRQGGQTYKIQPGTALAKKFPNFVNVDMLTTPASNSPLITPISSKSKGPLLDSFTTSTQPTEFSDEELNNLFQIPSFIKQLQDLDKQNFNLTTPSTSGSNSQPTTTHKETETQKTTGATKRKAADAGLTTPAPSKTQVTSPIEQDMVLPGTGRDDPMAVDVHTTAGGTGQGYSGGLATEKGETIPAVPRPYMFRMMDGFAHIRTCYSALSYGFCTRLLPHPRNLATQTAASAFILCATTPLLEIPWDKLNMYINPGVYDSLPNGTYVKSVHCKVIQRNVRVAFETAASDTSIATLNQNKFALMAIGLNNKQDIRVTNMRYNVGSNSTSMVPLTLSDPVYSDIDECLWGYSQNSANFNGAPLAANTFGVPIVPFSFNNTIHTKNYLVAWNTGNKTIAGYTNNPNGWYNLSQHVTKVPTTKVIDQVIINQDYHPSYAPIKAQLTFAEYLRGTLNITPPSGTAAVPVLFDTLAFNDHDVGKEFNSVTIGNISAALGVSPQESTALITTARTNYDALVSRTGLIEKGQYMKKIDSDHNGKYVQPSIHVGISCVPKLSTAVDQMLPDEYTDVQSYFDVQLDMVIGFNYKHSNTYQNTFNVEANEIRMAAPVIAPNRATDYLPNRFGHQSTY